MLVGDPNPVSPPSETRKRKKQSDASAKLGSERGSRLRKLQDKSPEPLSSKKLVETTLDAFIQRGKQAISRDGGSVTPDSALVDKEKDKCTGQGADESDSGSRKNPAVNTSSSSGALLQGSPPATQSRKASSIKPVALSSNVPASHKSPTASTSSTSKRTSRKSPAATVSTPRALALKEPTSGTVASDTAGPPPTEDADDELDREVASTWSAPKFEGPRKDSLGLATRVGLLVWAYQKGAPYWPAMLTYDPTHGNFRRRRAKGDTYSFHVQFFGKKLTRAWVMEKDVVLWKGVDGGTPPDPPKKKSLSAYLKKDIAIAKEQAQAASNLRTTERLISYVGEFKADLKDRLRLQELELEAQRMSAEGAMDVEEDKVFIKVKDKNKPKRAKTAYFYFADSIRDELRRENPQLEKKDLAAFARMTGERWSKLSEEQRVPFMDMFEKDKIRYAKEMKHYVPPPPIMVNASHKKAKLLKLKNKKLKDPNKPKQPTSAYIYFANNFRTLDSAKELSATDTIRRAGEEWSKLTDDEKAPFQAKAAMDKLRYKEQMLSYVPPEPVCQDEGDETSMKHQRPKCPKGPPDQPPTAEHLFAASEEEETDANLDHDDQITQAESLSAKWTALAESEKDVFRQQAAALTQQYEAQLEAYNGALAEYNEASANDRSTKRKKSGDDEGTTPGKKLKCGHGSSQDHDGTCSICEETGLLVQCEGSCFRSFHPRCVGLGCIPEGSFKCDSCTTGNFRCFLCDEVGGPDEPLGELRQCDEKNCKKLYHLACARGLPRSKFNTTEVYAERFVCPLHTCANCDLSATQKHKMVRCIRCPVVYHENCLPAGIELKERYRCVCPRHSPPGKHPTANFCVVCTGGGEVLICDGCPNTYHRRCIENTIGFQPPKEGENWFCQDCIGGSKPMVKDVVWTKFGNHRWWPAQIKEIAECPEIIARAEQLPGHFPVKFAGEDTFAWCNSGNTMPWLEGDEKGQFASLSNSSTAGKKQLFARALKEGKDMFASRKEERQNALDDIKGKIVEKPVTFKRIRANHYVCAKPSRQEVAECMCTADEGGRCGEDCLNRMTYIECDPSTCPAGKHCQNKRMLKRQYAKIKEFKTPDNRGWGLKCEHDLEPGDYVIEYVGEVITTGQCMERLKKQDKFGSESFYMLALGSDHIIDARLKANQARFVNHSCDPNCVTQKWNVNGESRVGIFACKHIPAGDELTFNYQLDCLGNVKKKCYCGAANCSGFIGAKPLENKEDGKEEDKKDLKKQKKKKKAKVEEDTSESACFNCGADGNLVLCDQKINKKDYCPKVYCLPCLGLDKAPRGKWICPWHQCNTCTKKASFHCSKCPTSYCSQDHLLGDGNTTTPGSTVPDPFVCSKCSEIGD